MILHHEASITKLTVLHNGEGQTEVKKSELETKCKSVAAAEVKDGNEDVADTAVSPDIGDIENNHPDEDEMDDELEMDPSLLESEDDAHRPEFRFNTSGEQRNVIQGSSFMIFLVDLVGAESKNTCSYKKFFCAALLTFVNL